MASFTTRVVLHEAESGDYENLHDYMKDKGFKRTIKSKKGNVYEMPEAEYNYSGNDTLDNVMDKAKKAATLTKRKYSVLITQSKRRKWYNLRKAK